MLREANVKPFFCYPPMVKKGKGGKITNPNLQQNKVRRNERIQLSNTRQDYYLGPVQ